MPVEVKELVVRAVATRGSTEQEKKAEANAPTTVSAQLTSAEREAIIQAAVNEVFRILREGSEP